jgi:hypothetical protein
MKKTAALLLCLALAAMILQPVPPSVNSNPVNNPVLADDPPPPMPPWPRPLMADDPPPPMPPWPRAERA